MAIPGIETMSTYKDTPLIPGDEVVLSYSSAGERIRIPAKVLCSNNINKGITVFIDDAQRVYRWKNRELYRIDHILNDYLESSEVHWINPANGRYLYVSPSSASYLLLMKESL